MVASYRYEVAKQGRAGCQNSACKAEGIKIQKGELRFGTLVQIPNFGDSWKWKHWGCVTPQQIANIIDQIGGLDGLDVNSDLDILDGYDELPQWAQDKIKDALVNGHVDDEDWKGEPELNRPGMKGINKRTPKKKKNADGESGSSGTEDSPVKPKKGGRKKKQVGSDDEDEEAAPKKKATSKKRKSADDADDNAEAAPPKKRAAKNKKAAVKDEDTEEEPKPKPAKKRASRAKKGAEEDELAEEPAVEPTKKKKTRGKKTKKEAEGEPSDEPAMPQNDGAEEAKSTKSKTKSASKKGNKRAAPVEETDEIEGELEADAAASNKTTVSRSKKAKLENNKEATSKTTNGKSSKKAKSAPENDDQVLAASDKKKQTRRGRGKKSVGAIPEDEKTDEIQPEEPDAADVAEDDTVEAEAQAEDTPIKKDKKKSRMGRSARRSNSKSEKA